MQCFASQVSFLQSVGLARQSLAASGKVQRTLALSGRGMCFGL